MSHETAPRRWMILPKNAAYPNFNEVHREDDWCAKAGCLPVCDASVIAGKEMVEPSAVPESTAGEPDGVIAELASALQSELGDCSSLAQELRTIVAALRASYNAGARAGAHPQPINPVDLARRFHTVYESLAPKFGYETRKESAKPWSQVPEKNQNLMIAVCAQIINDYGLSTGAHPSLGEAAQLFWRPVSESPKRTGDYLVARFTEKGKALNLFVVGLKFYTTDSGWHEAEGMTHWAVIPELTDAPQPEGKA
jgi:hypothetical protein